MSDEISRMDVAEFRRLGYLQEVNRQFHHPLGLALEVEVDDDGTERLGGVWDYRDDPAGMLYGVIDWDKFDRIRREWQARAKARTERLGLMVQPAEMLILHKRTGRGSMAGLVRRLARRDR